MGCFSWLYSDTKKAMKCGVNKDSFLLVPEEFQSIYGKYIKETYYRGYGDFSGYDVYELVAIWNKDCMRIKIEKPAREQYSEQFFYDIAVRRYENAVAMINDFKTRDNDYMVAVYGDEYLRDIGIMLACYDKDNRKLKYPIKITSVPMEYASAKYSKKDPNQGCD